MDLTPRIPLGRQVVERYGVGGFRVSGITHAGAILVFPDRTEGWAVESAAAIDAASLEAVIRHGETRILLLGLGRRMGIVPASLRATMRAAGISVEPMDTGAACRTYNVLLSEDRAVAAALLPIS